MFSEMTNPDKAKESPPPMLCVHDHNGTPVEMENIARNPEDPDEVKLQCPECGWIPVD